ncbi:MAG: FAD-dependent oxidoreductase [Tannerella sp.]|nr:FAD-dependent oxidoreductase [Tannerella sp.]
MINFSLSAKEQFIVIEAENFANTGTWAVDHQSIDRIGSSYLLAHGLGKPCVDAETFAVCPEQGAYHVWVRTREWSGSGLTDKAPGRFQVYINGTPLDTVFGMGKTEWNWHYGGKIQLPASTFKVSLRDLTGFEGRCDAIIFSTGDGLISHQSEDPLIDLRKLNGKPEKHTKHYDLVVTGGGLAGISAAIVAARQGLKVALIHNRPVLGGNNSPEIRIPVSGDLNCPPYTKLGNVTKALENPEKNGDWERNGAWKKEIILREKNIDLFLEMHVTDVAVKKNKIKSVTARHIRTNKLLRFKGKLFADCTGDGVIGYLAGADYRTGRESGSETGESLAPEKSDSLVLGASIFWNSGKSNTPVDFPGCIWALPFREESCQHVLSSAWNWEGGFQHDMAADVELIRDNLFLAIYGNWSFQKNHSVKKKQYAAYILSEMAYVLGKRESRRLMGDYVYSEHDIRSNDMLPDGLIPSKWGIDLHYADPVNEIFFSDKAFRSVAVHEQKQTHPVRYLPYRSLYSRNIRNLFMAGRCTGMTHVAHGMFRTQATTGMTGEVVGMAAFLCRKYGLTPRQVYFSRLNELKTLLKEI